MIDIVLYYDRAVAPSCRMVESLYRANEDCDGVRVRAIDTADGHDVGESALVQGIPTLVAIDGEGAVLGRHLGCMDEEGCAAWIGQFSVSNRDPRGICSPNHKRKDFRG